MFNFLRKTKTKHNCKDCHYVNIVDGCYYCKHLDRTTITHDYLTGDDDIEYDFCCLYNKNGTCKLWEKTTNKS